MTNYNVFRDKIAKEKADRAELLDLLEIPEYTNRTLTADRVKKIEGDIVTGMYGWSALAPAELIKVLLPRDPYILEEGPGGLIVGWLHKGVWYGRKSDQDIDREKREFDRATRERYQKLTDDNREDYLRREKLLPPWAFDLLENYKVSNPDFEHQPMGWGYTLVALELAVLFCNHYPEKETPEITEFAHKNGVTGNQYQWAAFIARNQRNMKGKI